MAKKKTSKKQVTTYETVIEVYCHRVAVSYWDIEPKLDEDLIMHLTKEAESRVKYGLEQECHQGELNCYYHLDDKEWEIRGWWEIICD